MSHQTSLRRALGLVTGTVAPVLHAMQRARGAGVVLLYHRVSPLPDPVYPPLTPEEFTTHCELIGKWYTVVPLSEIVARLRAGRSVRSCCAITFDDGYRDFIEFAYPILKQFGYPCTHFLVSDCLAAGRATWNLRLRNVLAGSMISNVECVREQKRWLLELARMPAAERYDWLDQREGRLGLRREEPSMIAPGDLPLVSSALVEWGSHTRSHAMLAYCSVEAARAELEGSRALLEGLVDRPVRYLSYPNGSYNTDIMTMAAESGYHGAVAVEQTEIGPASSPYSIERIDVGALPPALLAAEVTGVVQRLRRLTRL